MVGGFMRIRRALLATLSDAAYDTVQVLQFLVKPSLSQIQVVC